MRSERAALSPHFEIWEFDSRDGRQVPKSARPELVALCTKYLEPLRRKFGAVIVTSGYRSEAHNRAVGGAPASFHRYDIPGRYGVAADVHCARGTAEQWYQFLAQLGPGGLGRYPSFVHVDNRRGQARW